MSKHRKDCACRNCDLSRIEELEAANARLRQTALARKMAEVMEENERLREAMKQILDCEDCPEKIAREALRQEGGAE